MAKSKIIPIRSGIALKLDEKEKKLFVEDAQKNNKKWCSFLLKLDLYFYQSLYLHSHIQLFENYLLLMDIKSVNNSIELNNAFLTQKTIDNPVYSMNNLGKVL